MSVLDENDRLLGKGPPLPEHPVDDTVPAGGAAAPAQDDAEPVDLDARARRGFDHLDRIMEGIPAEGLAAYFDNRVELRDRLNDKISGLTRTSDAVEDLAAAYVTDEGRVAGTLDSLRVLKGLQRAIDSLLKQVRKAAKKLPPRPWTKPPPPPEDEDHDLPPFAEVEAYAELPPEHLIVTVAGFDMQFVRCPESDGGLLPATVRQVPMLLSRYWPNVNIRTEKGKLLDLPELLVSHGALATSMIYDLAAKAGRYEGDGRTGVVYARCAQRRRIEPKFDPQIDHWLRLFAGPRYHRLEAWLATVGRLDRPTAALYLRGEPGCGKGMLPLAIALLWGREVALYRDVLGTMFNSALKSSPIVLLDEGAPGPDNAHVVIDTETFRSFVSESARALTEKKKPTATLLGCPRLIISANHYNALKLRRSDTVADDEAIGQRILLIDVPEEAGAYLESIGGRDATEAWVAGGLLPQHLVWLEQNRAPAQVGRRFLVEGDGSWSEIQKRVREEGIAAAQLHVRDSPLAAKIGAFLDTKPYAPVKMDDILVQGLGRPPHAKVGPTPEQQRVEREIAAVLRARGYEKRRNRYQGELVTAYWPPPVSPVPMNFPERERSL